MLWRLNVAALGGIYLWALVDGRFTHTILALQKTVAPLVGIAGFPALYPPQLTWRLLTLAAVAVCALGSMVGVCAALFVGADRHRRLRSWLAFTLLVAAWLSLGVSWREVAWHGQQWRVKAHLNQFTAIAASLRADWPAEDGRRAELGAFMAYPRSEPRVLLVLTPPTQPPAVLAFSAVERSADGALRFELAGNEAGAWLEWHRRGDVPSSFFGGLMSHYHLERYASLGDGWYLARYYVD